MLTLLLVWGYFARPIYDFTWIALHRVKDKIGEKNNPWFAMPVEDLVALNSQLVTETDTYIAERRSQSASDPLLATMASAKTTAEYATASEGLRNVLHQTFGYPLADAVRGNDFSSVQQKLLGEDELATYTALVIPALGGADTTMINCVGILIVPKNHAPAMPLIIAAHGRGGMPAATGKINLMQAHNRDLAAGAIRRGWAVFEPIYLFYGKNQPENIRDILTVRAQQVGLSLPAIEFTKTQRSIDYLLTRPEFDASRVAMVGISYGGFNTLYTTALDPRIRAAVVAAYFNKREDILENSGPFGFYDWRFSHSLGLLRDPQVAALICPRPLQIQAGTQDQLFPIEGARETFPAAREYYRQLGLESRFDYHEFAGRHDFDGEAAWTFLEGVFAR
ncbi:MAG TPA: dienelactone hydrolase family protein [Chthoniobacterales bacterium]